MSTNLFDTLLESIDLDAQLLPYLDLSGWQQVERNDSNWSIWHIDAPEDDQPYELVFPVRSKRGERREYARKAIEFLAALHDEQEERTVQRVINYDRDVLFLRNTDTNVNQTLPLPLASDHVRGLERIFLYAASAEHDPKPYFDRPPRAAQTDVQGFSFGHTLPGSFIFTVTAPRLPALQPIQLTFKDLDGEEDRLIQLINRPRARRIGERVARGLQFIRQAERSQDSSLLITEYHSAFNANIYQALVEVALRGNAKVEFDIAWSPKLAPAHDVADFSPVRVRREEISTLKYVAKELRDTKPEPMTIAGNVRGLTVDDNPRLESARRVVILYGNNPITGRSANFIVELARDDYRRAIVAHTDWEFVQIAGTPVRSGDGWRLLDARDFRVFTV